ncbi:MAG: cyclic nucleotide-binding domain-containing protein [Spirochaetes bacterium]|nr:cyclic nucleotide-binding domain-containing protein [Spirochaetota bacterium]
MRQLPIKKNILRDELKDTLIFQHLSNDEFKPLLEACEQWEYAPGEAIVTQDSVSRYLYLLLGGSVDIMVHGKEKENIRISHIEKGDVFGEASIFLDVRRTASAIARDSARIISFSREAIFEYCNQNPRAGMKIFTFIIYSLLRKLSVINKDLAMERESMVTPEDLDMLKNMFPKTIDEIVGDSQT